MGNFGRFLSVHLFLAMVTTSNLSAQPAQENKNYVGEQIPRGSTHGASTSNEKFKHEARSSGVLLENLEARAYFKGSRNIRHCFNGDNVVACFVLGPTKMLFEYNSIEKYYELGIGQQGFCYAGRQGVFCDIYY